VPLEVELAPDVVAALDEWTQRQVRNAVTAAVELLTEGGLESWVRPWDLAGLRKGAAALGEVTSAVAVYLDDDVLVAELRPSGRHIAQRRVEHGWRLARFVEPGVTALPPETSRRVPLLGDGPDGVLATLGIDRPAGVTIEHSDEYLGQGETESRSGYRWTDGDRSVIAEEVRNEIFDGATPATWYLRGVVVEGDHGRILNGSGDDALLIEG
jgi:hypothetical protein